MATTIYQIKLVDELATNFRQTELIFVIRWFVEYKGISVDPSQWNEYSQWEEIAFEAVKELYKNEELPRLHAIEVYFATEIRPVKYMEYDYVENLRRTYYSLLPFSSAGIEIATLYYAIYSAWKNQTIRKQHPYGSLKEMIVQMMAKSEQRQRVITEEIPDFLFEQYIERSLPKGFTICKSVSDDVKLASLSYKLLAALLKRNDINIAALPNYDRGIEGSSILMILPKKIKREELYDFNAQRLETFLKIIGRRTQIDQIEYQLYVVVSKIFPGDRVIGFVPENLLYASATKTLRDWLLDVAVIKGMISIPSHALRPHSQTKISMIILDKQYMPDEKETDVYIAKANKLSDLETIVTNFYEWEHQHKIEAK